MARMHGSQCRVYIAERDASGDLTSVDVSAGVDTHDVTTFASAGWMEYAGGLGKAEVAVEGFYDPAVGGYGRQLEDLLGTTGGTISIYDGSADTLGDAGVLLPDGVLSKRGQPIKVSDFIKLSGTFTCTGRPGLQGRLLHPLATRTSTGTGSSYDNAASSANGGRANLHITAISGTWTIKVQHSPDGSAWSDLATFSGKTTAGGYTTEVTGTVNRYLRASYTEDVAGSITFVLGFARY